MATMAIVLTAAQADTVRGPSTTDPAAALSPLPLTDGRFYLGAQVLDDPAHAAHHDLLAACPVIDVTDLLPVVTEE